MSRNGPSPGSSPARICAKRVWKEYFEPMIRIEAGERKYELVKDWGKLPEGWTWGQVAGVACDSQDRVHVYTRTNHPYMIFDCSGELVHHGGEDSFDMAHSLYIDAADSVFVLSHRGHFIMKFDRDGEL